MNNVFNVITEFCDAMCRANIDCQPKDIIADSKIHRLPCVGDRPGRKSAAYVLHIDNYPAGWYCNHKSGVQCKWSANGTNLTLTAKDRADIVRAKQQRQHYAKNCQRKAVKKAQFIWNSSVLTINHPYLVSKAIKPFGCKVQRNNWLVCPLFNEKKKLVNLQFISITGEKRFLSGGRKQGCFWWIGQLTETLIIAEGFATAATLHQQTGYFCFIAFDAGNLMPVAKSVRSIFPNHKIIIAADHDASGVGQAKAEEAALLIDGFISMPPKLGQDWNDHYNDHRAKS